MTWYTRVVLRSAWIQVQQAAVFRFTFIISLVQPFFIAAVAFYTLRHRPDIEATYVAIGVSLSAIFSVMLFSGASALTRERFVGTLELLEASPAPLVAVFSGRMLGSIGVSLVSMSFSYAVVMGVFRLPVVIQEPAAFAVSLFLALVSMWSMGMLFGPVSIFWPPVEGFLQGLEYPIYILCGFLFPVLLLPGWLHPVSYVLPPYWAAYALHGSSLGALSTPELFRAWLLLLVTSSLMLSLSVLLFRLFMTRARRWGTLGYV
jgi:ABC-2 type transport system permease protein